MLYVDSDLTKLEEEARDFMIYNFNPVLKFVLMNANPEEFRRYGCNSCRQTAIFSIPILESVLPGYEINAYEGNFIDKKDGEEYLHAFVIAQNKTLKRKLLIDLSRVELPMLFQHVSGDSLYPSDNGYEGVTLLEKTHMSKSKYLYMSEPEYFTCKRPLETLNDILALMKSVTELPKKERFLFIENIYAATTKLLEGGEFS